jgi:hypothetical protein
MHRKIRPGIAKIILRRTLRSTNCSAGRYAHAAFAEVPPGAGTFLGLSVGLARAADLTAPPPPANWWDTLTVGGLLESGIHFNPDSPPDGLNFGHLFTDKANQAFAQPAAPDRPAPA